MDKILTCTLAALCLLISCSAPQPLFTSQNYSVKVSDELKENTKSVIRDHQTTITLNNPSSATYQIRESVTIFDKDDKDLATIVVGYDQFRTVDYIRANIIDKTGKIIASFSEKDAMDFSSYDGYTFFSDSRLKVLQLQHGQFPYSIEYEYQVSMNGILTLPGWYPKSFSQSVEKATLRLVDNTKGGMRYYKRNLEQEPAISETSDSKIYTWTVRDSPALQREAMGPPPEELLPNVSVSPTKFVLENSSGSFESWREFGKWYHSLSHDTRTLSDEAKEKIDLIVSGLKSEKEKVYALYDYMQQNMRYVSIQLGIGGWKPFTADYVFVNQYGDCKALTNFMQAMLEYVGIRANPVLIKSGIGESDIIHDFPSNQFNHVIVKVTLANGEVIWLECTSKYIPAGELGPSTEERSALLISEKGGTLIKTPNSNASENSNVENTRISVSGNGSALIESEIMTGGMIQHSLLHELMPVSENQRIEWFRKSLPGIDYEIKSFNFSDFGAEGAELSYTINSKNYASTSTSRLFIPLNSINSWGIVLPEDKTRKQSIHLPVVFLEAGNTIFEIPEGYEIEFLPEEISFESDFGSFTTSFELISPKEVKYSRKLEIDQKVFPPEKYKELRRFFSSISKAGEQQFVLVRKS